MAFSIRSTNERLPALIFGDFKVNIRQWMHDHPEYNNQTGYPIEDLVSGLGSDIVELFGGDGQVDVNIDYPSNVKNIFAHVEIAYNKNTGDINAVHFSVQQRGSSYHGVGITMTPNNIEGVYLMSTTSSLKENTEIMMIVKQRRTNGIYWLIGFNDANKDFWYTGLSAFDPQDPFTQPMTAGGFGPGDTTSDPIDFPDLPLVSALNTGVVNMYKANSVTLRAFSEYLWKGDFVDNVKKLFQDPMEAVVSIQLVPYTPPHADTASDVYLSWINTGVKMNPLTNQYVAVDCGSLKVSEFWSSFLDYPPHTDVSIYLPYIGVKQLSVQDVMSRTLRLIYHIDSLTGSCVAMLKCSGGGLDSVMYSWNGSCNMQMPISARDFSSIYSSVLSLAASAGLAIATKGASKALTAGAAAGAAASAINSLDLDTHTRQAGSTGSTSGYLGKQTPYLIITRPKDSTPENFNELNGRPSNLGGKVGDYSGFLSLSAVHIDGIVATEKEKGMIESALKSGILI